MSGCYICGKTFSSYSATNEKGNLCSTCYNNNLRTSFNEEINNQINKINEENIEKKNIILIGSGSTGKTTFLKIIQKMFHIF